METKQQTETREMTVSSDVDALRGKPSLSMIGFLLVEMIIGYEWLVSGVAKFVRGGFPAGLADELAEKSVNAPEWYRAFLESVAIPYAVPFGYFIEIAELLAGIALLVGPFIWLCRWDSVSDGVRRSVLFSTAAAAIGGAFLAINLHLANAGSHPWLIPDNGFDEGVDLDSVLPAIQAVIAVVSIIFLVRLRRGLPSLPGYRPIAIGDG